jgi:hypothetical protein
MSSTSTIDTTRIQSLCTIFLVQRRLFSLSLLPRLLLPFGLCIHIHPFASCRNQHTHVLHLHTVHSINPRSALQKRLHITAERTSLQLLDPVPLTCFVRVRFVVAIFVPWDLSVGNGRN